jgi:hypothetical protein
LHPCSLDAVLPIIREKRCPRLMRTVALRRLFRLALSDPT